MEEHCCKTLIMSHHNASMLITDIENVWVKGRIRSFRFFVFSHIRMMVYFRLGKG